MHPQACVLVWPSMGNFLYRVYRHRTLRSVASNLYSVGSKTCFRGSQPKVLEELVTDDSEGRGDCGRPHSQAKMCLYSLIWRLYYLAFAPG